MKNLLRNQTFAPRPRLPLAVAFLVPVVDRLLSCRVGEHKTFDLPFYVSLEVAG